MLFACWLITGYRLLASLALAFSFSFQGGGREKKNTHLLLCYKLKLSRWGIPEKNRGFRVSGLRIKAAREQQKKRHSIFRGLDEESQRQGQGETSAKLYMPWA